VPWGCVSVRGIFNSHQNDRARGEEAEEEDMLTDNGSDCGDYNCACDSGSDSVQGEGPKGANQHHQPGDFQHQVELPQHVLVAGPDSAQSQPRGAPILRQPHQAVLLR